MNSHILVLILIIVGSTLSETIIATAQPEQLLGNNSVPIAPPSNITDIELNSDDNRIILIWLKINGTDESQSDPTPAFAIDKHDFLNVFSQLFGNSNTTINAIE